MGAALVGWVVVQVLFIGPTSWLQVVCLAYGLGVLVLAAVLSPRS
ncbi:MAG: hypothetical protein ACRDKW_17765 [Actinomycetota bacterium]